MRYFPNILRPKQSAILTKEIVEEDEKPALRSRRRRGATAMEYLFVISLILCAAITGIGYFGQNSKASMQKSSDAVQKATSGR